MKRTAFALFVVLALLLSITGSVLAESRTYVAHLSGREEVPPADTRAQGQTIFRLSKDGTELYYKLIVANLYDIRQAHIHLAPAGANGGVVVWLFPSAPPATQLEGRFSGVLAEGVITEANFVGALAGQPLSALLEHFQSGNVYVNVHTTAFPGGEVRGQIR